MFKKMLPSRLLRSALFVLCLGSGAAQAAVTLSVSSSPAPSASMATFTLKSGLATTGYLTVLEGTGASCGTAANIQAGKVGGGATDAYRRGSLALEAGTNASYTVRNLAQSTAYTVCATDDAGSTVVSATFSTTAMATYASPQWQTVGVAASDGASNYPSLSFAPDGTPYVAYADGNQQKTTVKHLDGAAWTVVGSAGFSDEQTREHSLSFAPDGTPYVVYGEGVLFTSSLSGLIAQA